MNITIKGPLEQVMACMAYFRDSGNYKLLQLKNGVWLKTLPVEGDICEMSIECDNVVGIDDLFKPFNEMQELRVSAASIDERASILVEEEGSDTKVVKKLQAQSDGIPTGLPIAPAQFPRKAKRTRFSRKKGPLVELVPTEVPPSVTLLLPDGYTPPPPPSQEEVMARVISMLGEGILEPTKMKEILVELGHESTVSLENDGDARIKFMEALNKIKAPSSEENGIKEIALEGTNNEHQPTQLDPALIGE